jgi:hypothetical protein
MKNEEKTRIRESDSNIEGLNRGLHKKCREKNGG